MLEYRFIQVLVIHKTLSLVVQTYSKGSGDVMKKNNHVTSTVNGLFSNDEVINKKRKKLRQYSLESYQIEIAKRIVASPCKFLYRSIDPKIFRKNKVLE